MTASLDDVPIGTPVYGIGFGGAVRRFLRGYVVFTGRASRSEYWWAQLAVQLYVLVVSMGAVVLLVGVVFATVPSSSSGYGSRGLTPLAVLAFYGVLFLLMAPVLLPTYSSGARRLRDAGFSPWLILLALVPLGSYAVLVLTILPTKPDPAWAAGAWQHQAYGYAPQPGQAIAPGQPGTGYGYGYGGSAQAGYAQAGYGHTGYGTDPHGQAGYGQAGYGADPYGHPGAGTDPYGQATSGQAPTAQQHDGRQHDAGDQRQP
ncbi:MULTISPECIES: DUF805 domain-containing protein [unclassified Agrococcus]|uniref:DUF805 domain-containing protein n=1 Tax=unclassified Agrococcus TaxID=2615065 RepID=UPI0036181B91